MNYYRHNETKEVYAYSAESVAKTERLTVLESLIQANEPSFVEAQNNLQQALSALNESRNQLEDAIENEASEEEILSIQETLNLNEKAFNDVNDSFKEAESNYQPFKDEYDAALPVFFDIREKLKVMTKMTQKEIGNHLNPPVSKEQYIAEAEQKKQMLLSEATEAIAPLQDAVDLDMATDEEVSLLKEWKTYRVLLNRVDTSLAPDVSFPPKP